MVSPIGLTALLPLLAQATGVLGSALDSKHIRRHELERKHIVGNSIEARMARRAVGRQLAVHRADASACRRRGSGPAEFFAAAVTSGTASRTRSATATGSVSSTASTTRTSAGTTSETTQASVTTTAASQDQPATAAPSASPSPQTTQAAPPPPLSGGNTGFTPNGIKAGMSAGDSYDYVKDHIGWWYGKSHLHSPFDQPNRRATLFE